MLRYNGIQPQGDMQQGVMQQNGVKQQQFPIYMLGAISYNYFQFYYYQPVICLISAQNPCCFSCIFSASLAYLNANAAECWSC